jgi:hypothetical protein
LSFPNPILDTRKNIGMTIGVIVNVMIGIIVLLQRFRESEAPASLLKLLGAGAPSSIPPYNDTKATL